MAKVADGKDRRNAQNRRASCHLFWRHYKCRVVSQIFQARNLWHVRGGKDLRHHRCRDCGRLCLHLLGRPGSKRQCLKCSGKWDEKYIPVCYYHKGCKYCGKKWTSSYRKNWVVRHLSKLAYLFRDATWLSFRIYLVLLTGWLRNLDNYKLFRISFFKALLRLSLDRWKNLAGRTTQRKQENEELFNRFFKEPEDL